MLCSPAPVSLVLPKFPFLKLGWKHTYPTLYGEDQEKVDLDLKNSEGAPSTLRDSLSISRTLYHEGPLKSQEMRAGIKKSVSGPLLRD